MFSTKQNLERHIKTIHEGVKDYKCDICDKVFGRCDRLKEHNRTLEHLNMEKKLKNRTKCSLKIFPTNPGIEPRTSSMELSTSGPLTTMNPEVDLEVNPENFKENDSEETENLNNFERIDVKKEPSTPQIIIKSEKDDFDETENIFEKIDIKDEPL